METPSQTNARAGGVASATPRCTSGCSPAFPASTRSTCTRRSRRRRCRAGSVWRRGTCSAGAAPPPWRPRCACAGRRTAPALRARCRHGADAEPRHDPPPSPATSARATPSAWSSSSWASVTTTSSGPRPVRDNERGLHGNAIVTAGTPRRPGGGSPARRRARLVRRRVAPAEGRRPHGACVADRPRRRHPPSRSPPPTSRTERTPSTGPSRWRCSCRPSTSGPTAARPSSAAISTRWARP